MMEKSTAFRLRSDVRYRILSPEAVVIRQSQPEVIVLNEVGARVLELAASGIAVADMIEAMQREFEVPRDEIERDVAAFLQELQDAEVIEAAPASEHPAVP